MDLHTTSGKSCCNWQHPTILPACLGHDRKPVTTKLATKMLLNLVLTAIQPCMRGH